MNQAASLAGIIVAAVLAAAAFLAPQLFPARPAATIAAEEKATLATRQLFRYAQNAAELKHAGDLAALEQADFSKIVTRSDGSDEKAKTAFDVSNERFQEVLRALRDSDQKREARGASPANIRAPSIDPAGVQASVSATLKWLNENEKLLAAAEATAREAARDGRGVFGASQPLGMALLIRANEALTAAGRLRRAEELRRHALLARMREWKLAALDTRAAGDLSPAKAIGDLRVELEKLAKQKQETDAEVARVQTEMTDRAAKLASVRALLKSTGQKRTDLEGAGFKAGNDASFESYRATYRGLAEELATLEEQQQQWLHGGRKGATFENEDPLAGKIDGGEVIPGVTELLRRFEVLQGTDAAAKASEPFESPELMQEFARKSERAKVRGTAVELAAGIAAIEARIALLDATGQSAAQQKQRGDAALAALKTAMEALLKEIDGLGDQANNLEAAAIDAAQGAGRAFGDARSAADQWQADAARLRSEHDPNGQNARLRLIQNDRFAEADGGSAEVAARLLEARTHAQRVNSASAQLAALDELKATIPETEITKRAEIEAYIQTARDAGAATLKDAGELCQKLTGGGPTAWIGHGLLAAVHFTHSKLDAAGAESHRKDALAALEEATKGREKSPYLQEYLRLRELLKAALAGPAGA